MGSDVMKVVFITFTTKSVTRKGTLENDEWL